MERCTRKEKEKNTFGGSEEWYLRNGGTAEHLDLFREMTAGKSHHEIVRKNDHLKDSGTTLHQAILVIIGQGGVCPVGGCAQRVSLWDREAESDHNHNSGRHNAFLCSRHNNIAGRFHDSEQLLRRAAAYEQEQGGRNKWMRASPEELDRFEEEYPALMQELCHRAPKRKDKIQHVINDWALAIGIGNQCGWKCGVCDVALHPTKRSEWNTTGMRVACFDHKQAIEDEGVCSVRGILCSLCNHGLWNCPSGCQSCEAGMPCTKIIEDLLALAKYEESNSN